MLNSRHNSKPRRWQLLIWLLAVGCCATWAARASHAADEPAKTVEEKRRIVDREPFDRIVLDAKNNNAVLEVFALSAANRRRPEKIDANTKVRIRLVSKPDVEYDCAWNAIERIDTFETILMQEANQLIAEKRFDDAFEYLDKVRALNPNAPGIKDALHSFLYLNGGYLFAQEKYSEALAVMEELFRVNPNFKPKSGTLAAAIDKLASEIVSRSMAKQDYQQARQLLLRIKNTYGEKQKTLVDRWEGELNKLATAKRDEARQLAKADKHGEALVAVKEMLRIWPDVAGGRDLAKTIAEAYPLVFVGVSQSASVYDSSRFEDWSARRTGRLVRRRLCEFVGRGPEGGLYESPVGKLEPSDDGRQLTLVLDPAASGAIRGPDVAQRLLALATPGDPLYLPSWGGLVSGVSVQNVNRVRIDFRRPHVLPQALLQTLSDFEGTEQTAAAANGPYLPGKTAKGDVRFLLNPNYAFSKVGQPREIVERVFDKSDKAIQALRRGDIDALDRIFPADVPQLKNDSSLTVGRYTLPTLHLLVPNPNKSFTGNKTFRRALMYAIDRATILNRELCAGAKIEGCTVISGPFPPGNGVNDPLAYAYDDRIKPRAYNPRLAMLLLRLVEREFEEVAKKKEETAPELDELVLGYPSTEVARIACDAISQQLEPVGVKIKLKELAPNQLAELQPDCDLTYVELALWEPAVDASRLLGLGGFLPETNAYVGLALRRLEGASNWKDASDALKELHRIVYDDITVIPLWQLTEHFAHRNWLTGLEKDQVQLYQNVEKWRVTARGVGE